MRVKIKDDLSDRDWLLDNGFDFKTIYRGKRKDNGCIEIRGFEFEETDLEILEEPNYMAEMLKKYSRSKK